MGGDNEGGNSDSSIFRDAIPADDTPLRADFQRKSLIKLNSREIRFEGSIKYLFLPFPGNFPANIVKRVSCKVFQRVREIVLVQIPIILYHPFMLLSSW